MADFEGQNPPRRKRRTREHVLEDLSENHLERQVLLTGHLLRRPKRDYGVDVTMFHFADDGGIENGEVRFQLKASDSLKVIKQGTVISVSISTRDLHYWQLEIYPFILVVFNAKTESAYWLHVQEYVRLHPDCLDPDRENIQVHIPISNQLSTDSVARFRQLSLQIVQASKGKEGFRDDPRKPR